MTPSIWPTTPRTPPAVVPHRAVTTLATLGVPVAVLLAALAVALSWRGTLPDPIAIHWGTDGVNGYGHLASHLTAMVVTTLLMSLFLWSVGYFGGTAAMTRRMAGGIAVGFAVFMAGVFVGSLAPQRGLHDAAQAGSIGAVLAVWMVLAFIAGALVAWLTPPDLSQAATDPIPTGAPKVPLTESGQGAWVQDVTLGGTRWLLAAVVVVAAGAVVISRQWEIFAILGIVFSLLFVTLARWTVTVDRTGLTVRPLSRRPRIRVPLEEIIQAEVVTVRPIAEFGGYGLRIGRAGRTGLILRSGPSLQVTRTGGRTVVVTVDNAETGAALLNTLAARTRQSG